MSDLPDLATFVTTGDLALVMGPRAEELALLELSATLARHEVVRVLDGGNSYNALYVARYVRRHTVQLDETLNRIVVARAFTCYQMVTLLSETAVSPHPTLVLDLLATFGDESIDLGESHRLLTQVIGQLHRLRHQAPVVVSVRPLSGHQPERTGLLTRLIEAADHLFMRDSPATAAAQPPLLAIDETDGGADTTRRLPHPSTSNP